MTLTTAQKSELLQKIGNGIKVSTICREYGISRYTFYKWFNRWSKKRTLQSLDDQRKRGIEHWKSASRKRESIIKDVVSGHPKWSSHQISSFLLKKGIKVGNHGVHGVLKRCGLNKEIARLNFQNQAGVIVPEAKVEDFLPELKLRLLLAASEDKKKIASMCRQYGISRPTFYKWYKRWQENPLNWKELLLSRRPKGSSHWRHVPQDRQEQVLNLVALHPEYSVHQLYKSLNGAVGHHGIQNLLERYNLSSIERRLSCATRQTAPQVKPVTSWLGRLRSVWETFVPQTAPAPPLRLRHPADPQGKPPFSGNRFSSLLRPFLLSLASSSIFSLSTIGWLSVLANQPIEAKIGLSFATLALLIGMFFFLYSMKYYFTLALVLSFSAQGISLSLEKGENKEEKKSFAGWLARIFGIDTEGAGKQGKSGAYGLQANLEGVKINRHPFVSIHLPMYNERRVAERLITACAMMDYLDEETLKPNFEVLVCDDSTDETIEIVEKVASRFSHVRVLHRPTRDGFKGGALSYALRSMDPKTEFVVVFDADFIPYPDTLTSFMKYFKASGGWNEEKDYRAAPVVT
ncbi:MAG: glycosyltransferase, partial [bacterium]|nr:glycosyltransferase [bacterium]